LYFAAVQDAHSHLVPVPIAHLREVVTSILFTWLYVMLPKMSKAALHTFGTCHNALYSNRLWWRPEDAHALKGPACAPSREMGDFNIDRCHVGPREGQAPTLTGSGLLY
jgi:hypothetical protein